MTEATRERVDPLALEREGVRVEVDPSNGAITGISDRAVGLELIGNRGRAESWRLLIPLPERRGHYVRGTDQTLRESRVTDDGITLSWGPVRSDIGDIDVEVELDIRIVAEQVEFTLSLDNRSELRIEEAIAPVLAGITRPSDPREWRLVGPRVISGAWEYPVFDEVPSSYHGPVKSNTLHPYPGGWVNPTVSGCRGLRSSTATAAPCMSETTIPRWPSRRFWRSSTPSCASTATRRPRSALPHRSGGH